MAVKLLDNVTATGPGETFTAAELTLPVSQTEVASKISVVVVYETVPPMMVDIKLEGSHDKANWVELGNTTDVSSMVVGFASVDRPFPYFRANITEYDPGDPALGPINTGVTVTAVAEPPI